MSGARRGSRPGCRFGITFLLGVACLGAQSSQQAAVQVTALAAVAPPTITFTWPADATATSYSVVRRLPGAATWGSSTTIPGGGSATAWVDSNVAVGTRYDYWFTKNHSAGQARGFISSGIEVPVIDDRGVLILIVDATKALPLAGSIDRLVADLRGDGWSVLRHNVDPTQSVVSVKSLIVADYNANPTNVKAVFLLGRVPVPYSGAINPDGHSDHYGAWPADVYYGDVNGAWTDTLVNTVVASRAQNRNIPGDGKFDQSTLPSDVELMVGRVDLSNMPSFSRGEVDLLRSYLDKDHDYRHKLFAVDQRAVIDDNFGWFSGEAFAASGWRNFSALVDPANITAGDYFTLLNSSSGGGYAWSYGCGGGSYTSAGGIGSTANFVTSTNRNVFTLLFGSYFGDWDAGDSFLRAPLCSGWTLTNCWAGRPHWSFQQMAMGEPIGLCTRYSQNDTYAGNYGTRFIHLALMGDPTLRQHVIAPPSGVAATASGSGVLLSWTPSPEPVAGYHIYRAVGASGPYARLSGAPVSGATFTDTVPLAGTNAYLVKAARMEVSPSGSYWNLSQGVAAFACTPGTAVAQSIGTPCGSPAPRFQSTPPVLGQTLVLSIDSGPGNAVGQMLVGSIGTPLPIEGCELHLTVPSLAFFLPVLLDNTGAWSVSFPLPSDPSWSCIALDLQAAMFGPAGLGMSNAMRLVTGS